jgi:hypothetical protein
MYDEAYWHRLHQSSLVEVCPDHRCWLSYVIGVERPAETIVAAEEVIPCSGSIVKLDDDDPQYQLSLWMAQQVKWLLDNPKVPITSANLAAAYEQRLNEVGLVTVRRRFDYKRIRETFCLKMAHLIIDFEAACAKYHFKSRRSFCRALRNFDGAEGLHLYLMKFLEIDVWSLPGKSSQFHFEAGPWPCLNPACRYYGQNVISQYTIKTYAHGASIGSFACGCGYEYTRQAPDIQGLSRNIPHKIVATGAKWNARLTELWMNENNTLPEIAASLRSSKWHLEKMRKGLNLPHRRARVERLNSMPPVPKDYERQRKQREYRATIKKLRANDPQLARSGFYKLAAPQMQWLLEYDKEWLNGVLPKSRVWGPKVDWKARDAALAGMVDGLFRSLIGEDSLSGTRRISKARLVTSLGAKPALAVGRLPRTKLALENAAESHEEYRVRRLFWIIDHHAGDTPLKLESILAKAEIRLSMRTSEPFVEAILKAEELIRQKNLSATSWATDDVAYSQLIAA